MNIKEFIDFLKSKKYEINEDNKIAKILVNDIIISIDKEKNNYSIDNIKHDHSRIFDLNKPENFSVIMALISLFEKGYSKDVITLEKSWQLGHDSSGYLDIFIKNPDNNDVYMIEVKDFDKISRAITNEKEVKQIFSYAIQERNTKILTYYSYDFDNSKDVFYNVYCEEILKESQNVDDFYERWNKQFDNTNWIIDNPIFNITQKIKKCADLQELNDKATQQLYNQFLTILRLNSISDKPNAFMKMINLFLAKISDEVLEDQYYTIKDKNNNRHEIFGLQFQFVEGIDTNISFIKRLNFLYKYGMHHYLNKEVIDYSDEEIEHLVDDEKNNQELFKVFDNLRLKKNNNFAFIEVFDDDTFNENASIVKSMVEIIENYRLKYGSKHQFLGQFFEDLLNTSLKQEAGQFFTPEPIVDFMIDSIPYEEKIVDNLNKRDYDFIPSTIDYACGAGHFLIATMDHIQNILNRIYKNINSYNLTQNEKEKIKSYIDSQFSWVKGGKVIGIEKDYRLAKTTKIATFLNGDGEAEIISGDGINKFNSKEYLNTKLYCDGKKNETFDFVVSNPPYSVDGYQRNLIKNDITNESNTFDLLKKIDYKDSAIEKLFVERAEQLLKPGGIAAIILPQSILSGSKYIDLRYFIFNNFKIHAMLLTADMTFGGTTTSPVILFMEKTKTELNYNVLLLFSPKYLTPTAPKMKNKETKFLGYEFSSNRSKSGIKIYKNSELMNLAGITKEFILNGNLHTIPSIQNVKIKNIQEILLNSNDNNIGDIYPKYEKGNGKPLITYCQVNARTENDFDKVPTKYTEIGDLNAKEENKSHKINKTKRYAKKGDIVIATICPKKSQIKIIDEDSMLSTAIDVLSFKDDKTRDKVYNELIKDETINQMNSLLDGFKITYAKISDENLKNNVLIKI